MTCTCPNAIRFSFYVGLSSPDDGLGAWAAPIAWIVRRVRARRAVSLLAAHYESLTVTRSRGWWHGQPEPSLSVVVIETGEWERNAAHAEQLAKCLAETLGQQAVGLTIEALRFELVRSSLGTQA